VNGARLTDVLTASRCLFESMQDVVESVPLFTYLSAIYLHIYCFPVIARKEVLVIDQSSRSQDRIFGFFTIARCRKTCEYDDSWTAALCLMIFRTNMHLDNCTNPI